MNSTMPALRYWRRGERGERYVAEVGSEVLLDAGAEIGLRATDSDEGDEGLEEVVDEVGVRDHVGHVGEQVDEAVENGVAVGEDLRVSAQSEADSVVEEEHDAEEQSNRVVVGLLDGQLDVQQVFREREHRALQRVHVDLRPPCASAAHKQSHGSGTE